MQPIGLNVNVTFLVCLVLFLAARPKLRVLVAGAVAGACLGAHLGLHGNVVHKALQALSYWGAGAIPAVWLMPLLREKSDLKLLGKLLFPPCFGILAAQFLGLGSHGATYDHFLYAFDGSLGFQPSFWAGRMVMSTPWTSLVTGALYDALPLFLAIAYLIEERRGAVRARNVFFLILLVGLCGAACFFVFPAVGAYWLFAQSFPLHPPALAEIALAPTMIAAVVPRNCMPSLHTSWALVVFWAAGRCSWPWRMALRALLAIMLLQTLAYHYLADMIVAVPFTLTLFAITQTGVPWRSWPRMGAAGFGLASVAVWLVALRWGTPLFQASPMVPWSAALVTTLVGWRLWRGLDRAAAGQTVNTPVALPELRLARLDFKERPSLSDAGAIPE